MGHMKRQLLMWGAIATTAAVLPGMAMAASPDWGHKHGRGGSGPAVQGRALSRGEHDAWGIQIRGRSADKTSTAAAGMVRFGHRGEQKAEGLVGEIKCLSRDNAGVVQVTGTIKRSGSKDMKGGKKPGMPGATTAASGDDDGAALLDELAPLDPEESAELDAADTDAADPTLPGAPSAPAPDPGQKGPDKHKHGGELAGKDFAFTIDVPGNPQHFSLPKIGDAGTIPACSSGDAKTVPVTRGKFRSSDGSRGDNHKGDDGQGDHRHGWHR